MILPCKHANCNFYLALITLPNSSILSRGLHKYCEALLAWFWCNFFLDKGWTSLYIHKLDIYRQKLQEFLDSNP